MRHAPAARRRRAMRSGAVLVAMAAAAGTCLAVAGASGGRPPQGSTTRHGAPTGTVTTTTAAAPSTSVPASAATPTVSSTTTSPPTVASTGSAQAPAASDCPHDVASGLAWTGDATQLITVVSAGYTATYATLTAWQRQGTCWVAVLGPFTARIGAAGFSDHKHEGDDTTPTGAYAIGPVLYGNAPDPGTQFPYEQLVCGDWWDETPSSSTYNTFQYVPCGTTPPFGGDSEALWTDTVAYSSLAVIEYDADPVVPGAGSAVFLHATLGAASTGCVTIPVTDLEQVLGWLDPTDAPLIVMGPTTEVDSF